MNHFNRLERATQTLRETNQRGVAPYLTAGDGGLTQTLTVLHALEKAGATCAELGFPFSDPIADGPVLQAAAQRSLEAGTTFADTLEMVTTFRAEGGELPLAFMSYINPLLQHGGLSATCAQIALAGADALVVPDLPLEESEELEKTCQENHLAPILFAAPTSGNARIQKAGSRSRGFLYVVGRVGITGGTTAFDATAQKFLQTARQLSKAPIAVGFGIRTADDIRSATIHADLAVVGTALVEKLHRSNDSAKTAFDFLKELQSGLNA